MAAELPPNDEALERLLRDRRFGGPSHDESSPWDFVYEWPDRYLRERVWPIVSGMLVDSDELLRARAVELVARWHGGRDVTTRRILEVARERPELYADQRPENVPLRHALYSALCSCGTLHDGRAVAEVLCALWLERADDDAPATTVAQFFPEKVIDRARRATDADARWLAAAVGSIATYRRDALVPMLAALRHLSRELRLSLLAAAEEHVQRDDEQARATARSSDVPAPASPAPSVAECRVAIGVPSELPVDDALTVARAIGDAGKRAAALFVVATRVDAAGEPTRARALYESAARAGNAHAAMQLGLMLTSGRGGDVDAEAGVAWIARAAEAGLPTAAALLGGALLMRADAAADGVNWLRRAAAAQEPSAFWLLATAYLRGLGVARDPAQARLMMQTAAQHGVVEAQLELAQMYAAGVGGARDDAAAAAWELRAAEAGSVVACLRVGERALARAGGVARALPWLERAADGGSVEAAERLASLYRDGRELGRDEARAAAWQARAGELARASKT